jgi:hypothetical protein
MQLLVQMRTVRPLLSPGARPESPARTSPLASVPRRHSAVQPVQHDARLQALLACGLKAADSTAEM